MAEPYSGYFSVGEIAIAVTRSRYRGEEVEILAPLKLRLVSYTNPTTSREELCYVIRTPDGKRWAAAPEQLRKKRGPGDYDGNVVTSWDKCPWQPEELCVLQNSREGLI